MLYYIYMIWYYYIHNILFKKSRVSIKIQSNLNWVIIIISYNQDFRNCKHKSTCHIFFSKLLQLSNYRTFIYSSQLFLSFIAIISGL